MLVTKVRQLHTEPDNTGFTLQDITGTNSPSNPTGYGSPNPEYATQYRTEILLAPTGGTLETIYTSANVQFPSFFPNGQKVTKTIEDGIYDVEYRTAWNSYDPGGFDVSTAKKIVASNTLLATEGFTHVSLKDNPKMAVASVEASAKTINLVEAFPAGTTSPQDNLTYWWVAKTHLFVVNAVRLKLSKVVAASCDCARTMEWWCMLIQAEALFNLEDYDGASRLIAYIKQQVL